MNESRGFFSTDEDVITRSYGVAVYLVAQGHEVLGVRSRDGSPMNAYIRFPAAARADLDAYYTARDGLNQTIRDFLAPQPEQRA